MGFDCSGLYLGVHRPGVGMWICQVAANGDVSNALLLGDGPQSAKYSWVGFSSKIPVRRRARLDARPGSMMPAALARRAHPVRDARRRDFSPWAPMQGA